MKKDSKPVTRSDLVDLLGKIKSHFEPRFKTMEAGQQIIIKRLDHMEVGQKNIIHRFDRMDTRFDRMEKRNGHARNQIKKAGRALVDT